YYNSNLMNDELRRDVGTIKTRGASGWQAFSWILTSAIVTGILGSLGAVLMGALAALLSVTVKTFFVFDLTQLFDLTMTFHPNAIVTIFTFAFGVGIIVAIPVAVRAYLMTATEAHNILERESLLSQENLGSPMVELLALALSGYILVPTMTILGFFGFLSFMSLSFLIWLVPLLAVFIIAFARLAARPTSRFKSGIMEMIKKPSFRVGTQVMARTVLMYKKSEAMGVVFVAMVFTAGVFSSLSATTGYNHMVSVHKFYTGADFAITVDGSLSNVTLDLLENLTTVEGVSKVCPVFKVQGSIQYWTSEWTRRVYRNESILVYAVDLEKWKDTAFWLQYFTLLSTPENAISQMIENETNVLASFQPIDHYIQSGFYQTPVYGNAITLTLKGESWTNVSDMNIVDVMSNSQGSGQTYLPGEADSSRFVVVDLDYVHRCLNTTKINKFLVRMDLEANYTEVMRNLWEVAPYSFEGIESPYTEIDRVLDSKAGQSIYGIYTINVLFTIIYLSIGMMIVSTVRVRGLRKQFAVMRALGTESKSIKSAVLIDTTLSLLVAAGIGSLIGLMLSYFAINMPLVYFGTGTLSMWIRLPVFIAVPWLLLGAILALSCTFALAATYVVTSAALRKNIAEQIQYTE
ncbi:MAG: FtsX-like permease family protein, partial [Candidatus Thorarchaeota archaeon]